MDCAYSLKKIDSSVRRVGQEGFQLQYDLESDNSVFECKRLKGLSWNQAVKFFEKLESKAPFVTVGSFTLPKRCYLLFKSNNQPCLVMGRLLPDDDLICIMTFEDYFNTPFLKHLSMRVQHE